MTPELLKLISTVVEKEQVGTLYLGKGERVRRLFLSSQEVHLLEAGRECRFHPDPCLFQNSQFSRATLDELAMAVRRKPQSMAVLLAERGLLPEDELHAFSARELAEEILLVLARHGEQFFFEEGRVPEELLMSDDGRPSGLTLGAFVDAVQQRRTELREFATVFPSLEELLVLSEKGLLTRNEDRDWLFIQIAELIDGFRNIRSLLSDSVLFPHHTAMTLLRAARSGLLKKTVFPELEGIDQQGSPAEAREQIARFELAAEMAVDDLGIRKRLAQLCLRAGEVEAAIFQYNLIGDVLRDRGELAPALEMYREALRWDPDATLLQDKVVGVYLGFADQAFAQQQLGEARKFLEEALRHRTTDLPLYLRILETYETFDEALHQGAPRLLRFMNRAGLDPMGIALFEELVKKHPQDQSLRKRFVNLLLDRGEMDRAIQELEFLAGALLDRGESEEATQIYEKIALLAPDQSVVLRIADRLPRTKKERRPKWSFSGTVVIAILILLGGYQGYAFIRLADLDKQANALFVNEVPAPGSLDHRSFEDRADLMLRRLKSYRRRHVISVWRHFAAKTETIVQGRVNYLQHQLNNKLDSMFASAERAELLGRADDALARYQAVERLGKGSRWEQRAREHHDKLTRYIADASALLAHAQRADRNGDTAAAFDLYQGLLYKFPRSPASQNLTLPVTIDSLPSGAEAFANGEPIGKTPVVLRLRPFESTVLDVRHPGYLDEKTVIENPTDPVIRVRLHKK